LFAKEQILGRQVRPGGQSQADEREEILNTRKAMRRKDGRRFDMAPYRSRSGSAVAPVTRWTAWQAQINGRI
jgi:hypothetical protein